MPSSKAPAATVQPGPGIAPDGSVTATALNFVPSSGSSAAAQHVSDPVRAHVASAIGAGPYNSTQVWGVGNTSADGAFVEVFNGLAARAVVVLDANSSVVDADYVGPNALITAIAAAPKAIYYLRPGQYTWNDSSILSGLTIIGGGSPTTNLATTQVEIRNLSGNIRFSSGASLKNVLLTASGVVQVTSTAGGCTFENVHFKLTGNSVQVQTTNNVFRQCATHVSSTVATFLRDSGGQNSYDTVRVEQLEVTTNGGSTFTNLKVGSTTVAPSAPASPLVNLTAGHNVFNYLTISHFGAAITSNALCVASTGNSFNRVRVDATTTSVELVLFSAAGTNSTIDNLIVTSCTGCSAQTGSGLVRLSCNDAVVSNLRIASCTATGTNNVAVLFSDGFNTIDNLTAVTITAAAILRYSGTGNKVIGANISTSATGGSYIVDFTSTASSSVLRNARVGNFATAITGSLFQLQGYNNTIESVELPSITTLTVPMVHFTSAVGCKATGFKVTGLGVTAGAGFSFVRFTSSTGCTAGGIDVSTSPSLATTSGLLLFQTAVGCTVDGFNLNSVATTAPINGPLLTGNTGLNRRCAVRNVLSSGSSYSITGINIFDIDEAFWDGLRLEHIRFAESVGFAVHLRLRKTGLGARTSYLPIRVVDCDFTNASATAGQAVYASSFGTRAILEGCTISGAGAYALQVLDSLGLEFIECQVSGTGASTVTCDSRNSGAKYTRCTFIGPGGGTGNGTQLFCGYGFPGGSTFPQSPLVIEDCTMDLNTRNVAATGTTRPQVFFGGADNTAAAAPHGATVVRGLTITKLATATFPLWHNHSTLAIDIEGQAPNVQSYFENITVDLQGIPFGGDGTSATATHPSTDFNSIGALVEINGNESDDLTTVCRTTVVKGLSLLRLPRQGNVANTPGARTALLAAGVSIENLTVDAISGSSNGAPWYNAVMLFNCNLTGADFWPTTSLPLSVSVFLGGVVLFLADKTHARNVRMRNFRVASPAEQVFCVHCSTGSFTHSLVEMPLGSHVLDVGAILAGGDSVFSDNQVIFGESAQYNVVGLFTDNCKITNNRFENTAVPTGLGTGVRGGTCRLIMSGSHNLVAGNQLVFAWAVAAHSFLATENIIAMGVTADRNKIVNNLIHNTFDYDTAGFGTGGVCALTVRSGYDAYIAGNHLLCTHSTLVGAAMIDTSSGAETSFVVGNFVAVVGNGTGVITLHGSDKPTPAASYNIIT